MTATETLYATLLIALLVCAFGPEVWRAIARRVNECLDKDLKAWGER